MTIDALNICSETGKLKTVMLHRPSLELERITPQDLEHVLFEDIPWLRNMQMEHDGFADALRTNQCEILYVEDLLQMTFENETTTKSLMVSNILDYELKYDEDTKMLIRQFLMNLSNKQLIQYLIGGLSRDDIQIHDRSLIRYMPEDYKFYFSPLPNLYFMRDPAIVIGKGIALSAMYSEIRRRESAIMSLIYRYHPRFKDAPILYDGECRRMSLEGGDVLVLSPTTVCVGCSQRTSAYAIEMLAKELLFGNYGFESVIAVHIPHVRSFMHLDTVLTMVDKDKFLVYPGIIDQMKAVTMTEKSSGMIDFTEDESLEASLKRALGLNEILFIKSGGDNPITAAREQWNDSSNTLAIAPGTVIAYDRNEVSNAILRKNGIKVIEIQGSELVRGRGGPRCMSMPIYRENI